jgi:hypothetical protein
MSEEKQNDVSVVTLFFLSHYLSILLFGNYELVMSELPWLLIKITGFTVLFLGGLVIIPGF